MVSRAKFGLDGEFFRKSCRFEVVGDDNGEDLVGDVLEPGDRKLKFDLDGEEGGVVERGERGEPLPLPDCRMRYRLPE